MKVDYTALRFNQVCIIGMLLIGFLLDTFWLVGITAAVMLLGTLLSPASLFKQIYAQIFRRFGWLKPDVREESSRPHLFAQALGGVFLIAATLCGTVLALPILGWVLAGMVVMLAGINLAFGFCMGCFLYFQLGKRGLLRSSSAPSV